MDLQKILDSRIKTAVAELFQQQLETVEFQPTRKDFEGDLTVVIFPMLRVVRGNPEQIGTAIGEYLLEHVPEVEKFNVVKGFLNLVLSDSYYLDFFNSVSDFSSFGRKPQGKEAVMVEYSSPNTNKPLHLGHIRNILLGHAVSEIQKAAGKKVYKTQIVNDRGIHICKSMLAWQKFGGGETPESSGMKGDSLVGKYYVKFDEVYKKEIESLIESGKDPAEARAEAPVLLEAQEMLRKWEAGDDETVALWKKMNQWVYDGFEETYQALGVSFDFNYYESDTYLLGKDLVEEGLEKGVFYKKEDNSIWCDLTEEGLDEKLVLRGDGTAVYITQDIGTAVQRVANYPDISSMIYTVGNEQDYHFKVLFSILKKMGYSWAGQLYHLSYGMVDLPSGRMKSREGTVVDADDLIAEMNSTARAIADELGKIDNLSDGEKKKLYHTIGMGALKYFILKVDPKRRIVFNPEESVDFQGNTGPFIQYTYARIQSVLRRAEEENLVEGTVAEVSLTSGEKELLKILQQFPQIIRSAAAALSPALLANYVYDLVKEFNSFYQNTPIFGAETEAEKRFRIRLSEAVGEVVKSAFSLLGIEVPDRM